MKIGGAHFFWKTIFGLCTLIFVRFVSLNFSDKSECLLIIQVQRTKYQGLRTFLHGQSTVDLDYLAGDVPGFIGKQETGYLRHLVRFREPT